MPGNGRHHAARLRQQLGLPEQEPQRIFVPAVAGESPDRGVDMDGKPTLTMDYSTYLRLPELLRLQSSRSEPVHPDELHFIITHQAIELWFRVLIDDLRRVRVCIDADDFGAATAMLRRMCGFVEVTAAQMATLKRMRPQAFHQFREFLGTASGLESIQFREAEILSGGCTPEYERRLRGIFRDGLPPQLEAAFKEPSLADAHTEAAARRGISDWTALYIDHGQDWEFYLLTEALVDYDDTWRRWRGEHLALVLRMLGGEALGTAGTDSGYLAKRIYIRFFPYLWQARSGLTAHSGGKLATGKVDRDDG